jgi:acetylornithine/N-succinyldiaminopimelate aminotransferase
MAAAGAILDVAINQEFFGHVRAMGDRLRTSIEQLIPNHDQLFESVRGLGLMLGLRLKVESRAFVAHLRDHHGLLTVAAGDNVVRLLPPLIIEESHISEAIEKISAGARTYEHAS